MKKMTAVLFIIFFGCGDNKCLGFQNGCYQNHYLDITDYCVSPDVKTLSGIRVDTGGYDVNLLLLDERIAAIEHCLQSVMAEYQEITKEQMNEWQCLRNEFNFGEGLRRDCLVIKVVDPIYTPCSSWQHIPDDPAGARAVCLAEGMTPTDECPCMWRTAIQDENVIITPPDIYLWELGRIMTSCNRVWYSPFSRCLSTPEPER